MNKSSHRKVEVVNYNPGWIQLFTDESERLLPIFGDLLEKIYHIGSTSIPGMKAKPIIDILAEVTDINLVDPLNNELKALRYEAKGEFGIKGRRFFSKGGNKRTHHLHVFPSGHPEINRHLVFKEYMIAHPAEAVQYAELKSNLAHQHPYDIQSYIDGKNQFIKEIDRKAAIWVQSKR